MRAAKKLSLVTSKQLLQAQAQAEAQASSFFQHQHLTFFQQLRSSVNISHELCHLPKCTAKLRPLIPDYRRAPPRALQNYRQHGSAAV